MPNKNPRIKPKTWFRLGVWLLGIGVALMLVGLVIGYRFVTDQSVPAFLSAALEEGAFSNERLAGALVLCGPGVIVGVIGYCLIEKFEHHQWD